jgi:superfamily II DNA or RNA helicase
MAIKRTYGKISFDPEGKWSGLGKVGSWIISKAEPNICIKLKSIFEKIPKTGTVPFSFPNCPETCKDISWFIDRYPMQMSENDAKRLKKGTDKYETTINDLESILLPEYVCQNNYELNPGMAARHYQSVGVELFMKCDRLLVGDDLGLGKTIIAILSFLRKGTLPAAVVVQTHLYPQWIEQIQKFTTLSVHFVKGTKLYSLPKADVYIFKYGCLFGWVDIFISGFFKEVVFDEVQELRTGPGTKKYDAAKVLSDNAKRCMMLSATPIYNYAEEIFHILDLMKPGCLGEKWDFIREWAGYTKVFNNKTRVICKDPAALGTYLRQSFLFLRRTRAEVGMELPPINKIVHTIDYDEDVMEKDMELAKILAIRVFHGSFIEAGSAARELNALVRHATGVAKAKYVAEYVKMLLENDIPIVLVGWHRQVYKIWADELAEYKPVFYTGHESSSQKQEAFKSFTAGETNLFILSLRSGAGIDGLQYRCHYVVYGELDHSPKIHDQVTARVDRPGQDTQVTAVYLTSNTGSDPIMIETLGLKSSQMHGIIDPLIAPVGQYKPFTVWVSNK